MRRFATIGSALLLALLMLWAGTRSASAQGAKEEAVKKGRLNVLYKAYQAYETSNSKPATKVSDLQLTTQNVKELEKWLNLDELGVSLTETKKADLAKMVMAYEKAALKDGGLVMFYDGAVKKLTAAEVKKLVGKK